jgi:hypothetical protein
MQIPNVPESTIARMTKLALSIDEFPGSMLFEAAVRANPESPSVEETITDLIKKPDTIASIHMYSAYLNGVSGRRDNPAVRAILQKLTIIENEQVRKAAQDWLMGPTKKSP